MSQGAEYIICRNGVTLVIALYSYVNGRQQASHTTIVLHSVCARVHLRV